MVGIVHKAVKGTMDKGYASEWNDDHEITGDVECDQHQHLNHVWENRNDWPAGPVVGQVVYRTDFNNYFGWNGTMWQSLSPVATIVVAADGSGNYTDIQDGLDALPASGGVVYVKEGTYNITANITIDQNNTALIGSGKSTIISAAANGLEMIRSFGRDGILIKDLYILGDSSAGNRGIYFNGTDNSFISECWVESCEVGIRLSNMSDYNHLLNNFVKLNTSHGIHIFGPITKNSVIGNTVMQNQGTGILLWNMCSECVVGSNLLLLNQDNGIEVAELCTFNLVNGNSVAANFNIGIDINKSANNVIDGNSARGNGTAGANQGIELVNNSDRNIVSNNQATNNSGTGILVAAVAETRNIVTSNVAVNNTVAQITDNGTNTNVANNQVA